MIVDAVVPPELTLYKKPAFHEDVDAEYEEVNPVLETVDPVLLI